MYVKSTPYVDGHDHRVYDYSTSDNTWNISPIRFQDSFKALAIRNDQIVLIDSYKEEAGKEFIRIFPLSGDVDATMKLPLDAGSKDASQLQPMFLSATSDKNTLVIVYSSVKVLVDQPEQTELALDLPVTLSRVPSRKYYFWSLLYDNHLYLSPISIESRYASECQWYYTQLPQRDEQTEHDKTPSTVDDDLLPPQHKKAQLDQASAIKWKHMPQLPRCYSNLACFGKQLVTVRGSWPIGIKIRAYSPITNSWVVVAETNEDFDHILSDYSSIVHLDDTGELMLIECGSNHRDVYKLSIEGT